MRQRRDRRKQWMRHIRIFACVFVLCASVSIGVWRAFLDPRRGTAKALRQTDELSTLLTEERALEDLDYVLERLAERHPACVGGLPATLAAAYHRERDSISQSGGATVLSLWQSSARILSELGDAHTSIGIKTEKPKQLPMDFEWVGDTLCVFGGEYGGYEVTKVGGISTSVLYERFCAQFSYELKSWARYAFASRVGMSEFLSFVGVDPEPDVEVALRHPDEGTPLQVRLHPEERASALAGDPESYFSSAVDETEGTGIFTLRRCVYDDAYKKGLAALFTSIREAGVSSVVVDLRHNPGGNSMVASEFIRYLDVSDYMTWGTEVRFGPFVWRFKRQRVKNHLIEPVFAGDIYVLTAADTFSSAMDFAVLISDNELGLVVGETPGNMPSSYGDILYFQTPNSGLVLTVSYKRFLRPDESKTELPLVPDVEVIAGEAMAEAMRLVGDKNR